MHLPLSFYVPFLTWMINLPYTFHSFINGTPFTFLVYTFSLGLERCIPWLNAVNAQYF